MDKAITISDFFSLLSEAESILHDSFVGPEFIPGMTERCQKALEAIQFSKLELNDDTQRILSAVKTMGFLISGLQKRYQQWQNYKLIVKRIKLDFKNSRSILFDLKSKEKRDIQEVRKEIEMLNENSSLLRIRHNLVILQKLEEVFGNEISRKGHWFYHAKLKRLEEEFQFLSVKFELELDQVETFEKSAADLKQELDQVEVLIDFFQHEESTALKKFIKSALETLDVKIHHIQEKIIDSEPRRHNVSTDHIIIEYLNSSELKPEDARNQLAKLQELYGPKNVGLEEEVENNLSNADQVPKVDKLTESTVEEKSDELRQRDQPNLDKETLDNIASENEGSDVRKLDVVGNEDKTFEEEKPIVLKAPPALEDFSSLEEEMEKELQQKLQEQNRLFEEKLSSKREQREKSNREAQDEIRAIKERQSKILKDFLPK